MPTYTPLKRKQAVEGMLAGYLGHLLAGVSQFNRVPLKVGQTLENYTLPIVIASVTSDQRYMPRTLLYQAQATIYLKTSLYEAPRASESEVDIEAQKAASLAIHQERLDFLSNAFEDEDAILPLVNQPEGEDTRAQKDITVLSIEIVGDDQDRSDGHIEDEIRLLVTFQPFDVPPELRAGG